MSQSTYSQGWRKHFDFGQAKYKFEASYHDSPKIDMQSMPDSRRSGGMPQNLKLLALRLNLNVVMIIIQ